MTHCADCNEPYGSPRFPDLIIEDWAWKRISPTGDEGGLLCPNCICARLHIEGVFSRSVFTSGYLALVDETPTWLLKERLLRLEERIQSLGRENTGVEK